ncbi:hypothetical protein LCGC14_2130630 [marine sediment metagenome]|uniref:Uncharacterized protein n=1 Tax=marine sediment metagenome TaxID=412755 RepID=A0A0F9E1L2_9ZZZZ
MNNNYTPKIFFGYSIFSYGISIIYIIIGIYNIKTYEKSYKYCVFLFIWLIVTGIVNIILMTLVYFLYKFKNKSEKTIYWSKFFIIFITIFQITWWYIAIAYLSTISSSVYNCKSSQKYKEIWIIVIIELVFIPIRTCFQYILTCGFMN